MFARRSVSIPGPTPVVCIAYRLVRRLVQPYAAFIVFRPEFGIEPKISEDGNEKTYLRKLRRSGVVGVLPKAWMQIHSSLVAVCGEFASSGFFSEIYRGSLGLRRRDEHVRLRSGST